MLFSLCVYLLDFGHRRFVDDEFVGVQDVIHADDVTQIVVLTPGMLRAESTTFLRTSGVTTSALPETPTSLRNVDEVLGLALRSAPGCR